MSAEYLYFTPYGKWKYSGTGASIPMNGQTITHEYIWGLNGGNFPGITSSLDTGCYYTIIVVDPESFPRMIMSDRLSHLNHV